MNVILKKDMYAPVAILLLSTVGAFIFVELFFTFGPAALSLFGIIPALFLLAFLVPLFYSKLVWLRSQLAWWHVLWLLVFLSGLTFRVRESDAIKESPIDIWALYRIALSGIVGFVLLIKLGLQQLDWFGQLFRGVLVLFAVYTALALASTLWSVFSIWTLYKSAEYAVEIALMAALLQALHSTYQYKVLFDWMWFLSGAIAVSIFLGMILAPNQAISNQAGLLSIRIRGVFPSISENGVGDSGATLGLIALVRLIFGKNKRDRILYFIILISSLILLILSQSRSPLVGFLLGAAIVSFLAQKKEIAIFLVLLSLFFWVGIGPIFETFFRRGQNAELFTTLSGRTEWWEQAWKLFQQRPFLGAGAYAAARFSVLSELGSMETSSIHNTWLELLIGVGLIGTVPVVVAFLKTWANLLRVIPRLPAQTLEYRLLVEAVGILTLLSFRTIFTSLIVMHPALLFLLVLIYSEFLVRKVTTGQTASEVVDALEKSSQHLGRAGYGRPMREV